MQFLDFLKAATHKEFFEKNHVLAFKGQEYPLLFFSGLLQKIVKEHEIALQRIDLQTAELAAVKSQLSMSFLGAEQLCWLGNVAELDAKKRQSWMVYARDYAGPHKIAFFVDEESSDKNDDIGFIEVPAVIDEKIYGALQKFLKPESAQKKQFSKKVWTGGEKVSLDVACMLLEYQTVAGAGAEQFLNDWFSKIVPSEKSLFLLSQYFFAKSSTTFMKQWHEVRAEYPDIFWITFWSEQLWRAYHVVKLYQEKKVVDAKKISFRLPFSFVQRDWRKASLIELRNAHQFMYDLDYKIKNGASDVGLDLFYTKFFSGEFGSPKPSRQ